MNRWMDLNKTCTDTCFGQPKKLLDFHDLDLIFKVTRSYNYEKKPSALPALYLMIQWPDFDQTGTDIFGSCLIKD